MPNYVSHGTLTMIAHDTTIAVSGRNYEEIMVNVEYLAVNLQNVMRDRVILNKISTFLQSLF